ncbi:unnamed protein product [Nezara viridula]|uniref:Menorin-like domain-containing protein n=1 Tax=Nezara viridula TaxID=85310 RepID=A0A9P0HLE6_NEZVI|nr:unnamed protein product [Nezara viridula]
MKWTENTWFFVGKYRNSVMAHHETLADYFPEIKGDLTKVTWVHAVNTLEKLADALNGKALMIEADIVLGWKSEEDRKNKTKPLPVMAHPPAVISNLTLAEFLETFMQSGARKGIKLDFKSRGAFAASEWLIEKLYYEKYRDFPVWLNADIVPGPVNATAHVVDPDYFLSSCFTKFPYSTISVGWTTKLEPGSLEGVYSKEDVDLMTDVLSNNMITMPVTFAVRAAFAARSIERMIALIDTSPPGSTLTIWSSVASDVIDVAALGRLIDEIGIDRVYLDLPNDIIKNLNHSRKTSSSPTIKPLLGLKAEFHQLDIDDIQSITNFANFIKKTHGGIDVLVNNAAIALFPLLRPHARVVNVSSAVGFLQNIPDADLKKKLGDPNLTLNDLTSLMKQYISEARAGTHGEAGWPSNMYCNYTVSKVGVSALTRIQHREFLEDPREDIVINHVHPGYVATDMTEHLGPHTVEEGSDAITYAALLPAGTKSPKGDFIWRDRQIIDWVNGPAPAFY